jgi:hypothetical protein
MKPPINLVESIVNSVPEQTTTKPPRGIWQRRRRRARAVAAAATRARTAIKPCRPARRRSARCSRPRRRRPRCPPRRRGCTPRCRRGGHLCARWRRARSRAPSRRRWPASGIAWRRSATSRGSRTRATPGCPSPSRGAATPTTPRPTTSAPASGSRRSCSPKPSPSLPRMVRVFSYCSSNRAYVPHAAHGSLFFLFCYAAHGFDFSIECRVL